MPNHLVLVRHGESEGNYVRSLFKEKSLTDDEYLVYQFRERPGHEWRLTPEGVQQAQAAGAWITEHILQANNLEGFDRYMSSPHRRTVETAGHLAIAGAQWRINRMLRERSWGELENLTGDDEHKKLYPANYDWMKKDPLNWAPPGGESIVQVADTRVREVFDTLHRDQEKGIDSVLLSTHGEWIWAARLVLGYMLNDDWDRTKEDPAQKVHNCQVVHFTRQNPESGEPADYLRWMRSVNPYRQETESDWIELSRPTLSNEQMVELAERLPRITR